MLQFEQVNKNVNWIEQSIRIYEKNDEDVWKLLDNLFLIISNQQRQIDELYFEIKLLRNKS